MQATQEFSGYHWDMVIDLELKNYRCFPDRSPARFRISPGFVSFVGANNAGKSTLLRFFFELRQLFEQLANPGDLNFFQSTPENVCSTSRTGFPVPDVAELFSEDSDRDMTIRVSIVDVSDLKPLPEPFLKDVGVRLSRDGTRYWAVYDEPFQGNAVVLNGDAGFRVKLGTRSYALGHIQKAFAELASTVYIGPIRNAVTAGGSEAYFDLSIGTSFIKEWRDAKGGSAKVLNNLARQVTEDIREVFGFRSLEINPSANDKALHLFVDGKSRRLDEMGGGLAQFIVTLGNVAFKQRAYVLVDEPELGLHPKLQLRFLEALASYAKRGVLFATHSYGLARAASNLIHSVVVRSDGCSAVQPFEAVKNLSEFLGEMSYSGYVNLGFTQVLLVEGPTDLQAIQQFLRMLKKDHQVVMIHLGGASTIKAHAASELQELKRICDQVSVIIDSERSSADARLELSRERFQECCEAVGIRCHVLKRRSLENYLSDAAVKRVKGDKYNALPEFSALADASLAWGKEENWKIAREMRFDDIAKTDLGEFLVSL